MRKIICFIIFYVKLKYPDLNIIWKSFTVSRSKSVILLNASFVSGSGYGTQNSRIKSYFLDTGKDQMQIFGYPLTTLLVIY